MNLLILRIIKHSLRGSRRYCDKIVHLKKERGIDVNMKDAARSNATASYIASVDIEVILSESGADLNAKGPWD